MIPQRITRRAFKKAVAAASTLSFFPSVVLGANERIRIGVIGCGDRACKELIPRVFQVAEECNAKIVAVCDVWKQHREEASAMVKERFEQEPKATSDYRELFEWSDLDAVIIATPEHQHIPMLMDAIRAGKDVYIEKPLAMTLEELNPAVDLVKGSGRIVQVGTQLRSYPSFTGCKKVVQEGALGIVHKIMQVRNQYAPYWHRYKRSLQESDTDWKRFLMNRPDRPFDADQHACWYGYREFSLGPVASLMAHFIDLVHYVTGAQFPHSAVTLGGNYVWKEPYTVSDSIHTLLDYPEGFMVSYTTAFGNSGGSYLRFFGTRGLLDATDWRKPVLSGEGSEAPDRIQQKEQVPDIAHPEHMQDWLQCIRSRKQPNANIDAGEQHAVACILSNEAWLHNRRMAYDRKTRSIQAV